MHTFRESGFLTRSQALSLITRELGFPNPSPKFLSLYFDKDGECYMPKVDFTALGKVIAEKDLVKRLGNVIHLQKDDKNRSAIITEICAVVNQHALS